MSDMRAVAEAVRRACLDVALAAYEDAGLSGLCQEGRWECAVEAIRGLDLDSILDTPHARDAEPKGAGRPPRIRDRG
jgi:hypothetical protein